MNAFENWKAEHVKSGQITHDGVCVIYLRNGGSGCGDDEASACRDAARLNGLPIPPLPPGSLEEIPAGFNPDELFSSLGFKRPSFNWDSVAWVHAGTGVRVRFEDLDKMKTPADVVKYIHDYGQASGKKAVRKAMMEALGLQYRI